MTSSIKPEVHNITSLPEEDRKIRSRTDTLTEREREREREREKERQTDTLITILRSPVTAE